MRLPFFYGWVIVACTACAAIARQGCAVATLSIFITPMTTTFDWSRTGISGAVSLGGALGALISPAIGPLVDRIGARAVLVVSALVVAACCLSLSWTQSLLWFYVAFSIGRMTFATPFDIGISAAVCNWFVVRRAQAMSYVTLAIGCGLVLMPLLAQTVTNLWDWPTAWVAIGLVVFVVGVVPNALFMIRRPEDLELLPDGGEPRQSRTQAVPSRTTEVNYTVREAAHTASFWLLMAYSAVIFSVQAGLSLHQAPLMLERGLSPTNAALIVSVFSLTAALSGLLFGRLGWSVRQGLVVASSLTLCGALVMTWVTTVWQGHLAAALFGAGMGGVLTLVPVIWGDYYGRAHYGAIRGITLPVQVVGQATGPIIGGVLFDLAGSYDAALQVFVTLAAISIVLALLATPPKPRD